MICNSNVYSRSSTATEQNQADTQFYSHAVVKSMPAEVLLDAVCDVTDVADDPEARAVSLTWGQGNSDALNVLGRCDRSDSCETPGPGGSGIALKLHLMNGPLLNDRITAIDGRLHRLLKRDANSEDVITEFYRRALSRGPKHKTNWNSGWPSSKQPTSMTVIKWPKTSSGPSSPATNSSRITENREDDCPCLLFLL